LVDHKQIIKTGTGHRQWQAPRLQLGHLTAFGSHWQRRTGSPLTIAQGISQQPQVGAMLCAARFQNFRLRSSFFVIAVPK
jgi:hypothetical protein